MSVVMEDGLESRPLPRTALLRLIAMFGGLFLAWMAAAGWLVAHEILRGLQYVSAQGDAAELFASDTLDETTADANQLGIAHAGLSGAARFFDSWLGDLFWATQKFEWLVALAAVGGIAATAAAFCRRPWNAWPEWLWAVCAVVALVPAVAGHYWMIVGIPAASLLATASVMHLLHRRDVTPTRGKAIAKQHVAPRAQQTLGQATRTGKQVVEKSAPVVDKASRAGQRALEVGVPATRKLAARVNRKERGEPVLPAAGRWSREEPPAPNAAPPTQLTPGDPLAGPPADADGLH
jgi:hypothetical protein